MITSKQTSTMRWYSATVRQYRREWPQAALIIQFEFFFYENEMYRKSRKGLFHFLKVAPPVHESFHVFSFRWLFPVRFIGMDRTVYLSVYRCTESASNLKEEYRSSGQIGTSDVMSSQWNTVSVIAGADLRGCGLSVFTGEGSFTPTPPLFIYNLDNEKSL